QPPALGVSTDRLTGNLRRGDSGPGKGVPASVTPHSLEPMARAPRHRGDRGSSPMRLRVVLLVAAVGVALGAPASHAASLIVVDGILYGATDVQVGSKFYNVLFKSDSCRNLFQGCDSQLDFQFGGQPVNAAMAAQALLDQVLIDGPLGAFDSDPTKTNGIESLQVGQFALIGTPFKQNFPTDLLVTIAAAVNCRAAGPCGGYSADAVDTTWGFDSLTHFTTLTYAIWSP